GRRDTFPNPNHDPSEPDWRINRSEIYYTSSSINTLNKHSWKYGRFEIRAKIKAEEGLWPAIWTLGTGHEWPSGGEIDIMEYYGGNILANAAWAGPERWQAIWDDSRTAVSSLGDEGWDQKFHVWRMDWDVKDIKLFVDDQLLNTIDLSKTINQRGTVTNPFREPRHYLLLNLAIGGQNGGDPRETAFPSRYEVDYVRVYQKQ
ncbi:MAG: glycoside hydrolase family 16 protein, partial [Bacteroidota bacterium]